MSKVMDIFLSNFGSFCDDNSPNMVMSRDPTCKFRFFYFVLILHLIIRKVTTFLVEKLSTSEVISKKLTGGGVWKTSPPSAFKVKIFITKTLKNEVKHDVHKEVKSEAESSLDHVFRMTNVKAFVHPQLPAQKDR